MGLPKNGWLIRQNPMKIRMIWRYHQFRKPPNGWSGHEFHWWNGCVPGIVSVRDNQKTWHNNHIQLHHIPDIWYVHIYTYINYIYICMERCNIPVPLCVIDTTLLWLCPTAPPRAQWKWTTAAGAALWSWRWGTIQMDNWDVGSSGQDRVSLRSNWSPGTRCTGGLFFFVRFLNGE